MVAKPCNCIGSIFIGSIFWSFFPLVMQLSPLVATPDRSLYEQVADRMALLIAEGTLQTGDRMPSVRKLHKQLSVSISTVLEAYRLLEDRGLIQARPQSGYYVKASIHTGTAPPEEPTPSSPPIQASPVTDCLTWLVQSLQSRDTIQLGAAVPAMEMLPLNALNRAMGQVMRQNPLAAHSYDVPPGYEPLRHEIARRMIDRGCSVTPDEVMITNGAFEAVYLSLLATTQPGDTVAIESPTYYGLLDALEQLNLRALELPTHPRDGLSLDHLETALRKKQVQAIALVSNYSNPLGSCMDDAKKKQLADLVARYQVPLIEDDVAGDISHSAIRPKAIKAFDTTGLILYCASYSKTLSPGLRIGWCVAGQFQADVAQQKWTVNQCTAIALQMTVASFLQNGGYDRHLRQLRQAYQFQMAKMIQAICDYFPAETKVTRPSGGHLLWVEIPGLDSMALYEQAMAQRISIAPGAIFSPSRSCGQCFRLNCSEPWTPRIEQAMKTLGEIMNQLEFKRFTQWIHSVDSFG